MAGALIFAAAAQGTPLDCLALKARGSLGSGLTIEEIDSSWQATTPRALHRQHTETHPIFL